jgi:hypothetical protein
MVRKELCVFVSTSLFISHIFVVFLAFKADASHLLLIAREERDNDVRTEMHHDVLSTCMR